MPYDPTRHHRRSIRLSGYDYTQQGAYFITICANHRVQWFGRVEAGGMKCSRAGRIVETAWHELADRFPHIVLDAFVTMPDHVHGIIEIVDRYERQGEEGRPSQSTAERRSEPTGRTLIPRAPAGSIGDIVRVFKAVCTRRIRQQVHPRFAWQRNYWERIVRDQGELDRIRRYIADNLRRWYQDRHGGRD